MMMGRRPHRMKTIVGILKDKASILKATLVLSSKPTSSLHVAILRATTHHPQEAPPPVDAVLSLAHRHRPSAGVLIHALLLRVHGTRNAYVALKCLITLHHVITQGSPALKDLVLSYSTGPLFNLSTFTDDSDDETLELSNWVRWYADVLDYGLALSRGRNRAGKLSCFVTMVEKICGAPESLHYQRISLIYEVMKLIGEDYRMVMREIKSRVNQFGEKRIANMNDELLDELLEDLKRLQDCKEKLLLMFLNKKKNDGVWELIEEARKDVEAVKRKREQPSRTRSLAVAVVPKTRVKRWLDVEWNPMVASFA